MKIINTIKRTILSIVLLILTFRNLELAAGFFETIGISASTPTTLPNFAIKVAYTTPTGNEISAVQLQINDTTANGQFVKQFQGKELEQLVAEAKKSYPGQSLDNAISLSLQDSLRNADLGSIKPLIALLDPNRHDRLEHEFQLKDLELQLKRNSSNQQKTELKLQPSENIPTESAELRHKTETDLARVRFEQSTIRDNANELNRLNKQHEYRTQLRNDYSSFTERVGGIHRLNQKTIAFFESPSIKKLFDLYNYKIFDGNLNTLAKQAVEAQWSCRKIALFNQYISVNNGIIEHYEPSQKTKELFVYYITELSNECAPEVFEIFYNKMMQVPEFMPTLEYIESKKGNFFEWLGNKIVYHANNTTDNAAKWFKTNTISWSPTFEQEKHFKHLGTIDTLCREGKLEQARKLASPNVAIEQELIAEHSRLANVVTPQQQATPTTPKQEVTTPEQMPLIDSMSIAIAQKSLNSNFPVNPYTVSVMRDYYGQDVKEITDFAPTNFKQLMVHDHITTTINKLSHRVFNASNVTEQALALYGIDAYVKAYELNKNEKLTLISDFLQQFEKEVDNAYLEMGTTFLKRLSHNAQHPVKYIREQVTGVLQLAYFIADASLGQFFRTTEQNNQFANNISKFINEFDRPLLEASQKEILAAVGALMADMAFDAGIACLAKLGAKVATAQLPKITAKAIGALERVNEVTQGKKQEIAITPEGIPLVLKSEAEHVAKQTSKEAIKDVALTGNITSKMTPEIAEHIKAKLSKNKHLLDELDKKINELSKNVNMQKVGELIHDPKYLKLEEVAAEFYEKMRSISSDITAIAHNTGISEEIINQIKNHVFLEDHVLRDGTTRFFPMPDMAAAWQRLIDNKFVRSDLLLLQHEYAESFIMNGVEIGYEHAHSIVNQLYNWKNSL